jgi:ribose 5-phosphate isomerase B
MTKPIALASDHGGFVLKTLVKGVLDERSISYTDHGTNSDESCDYPDYGGPAAQAVSEGVSDRGILCCGSGAGMTIVANKFPGVRAVNCYDETSTLLSRQHNDANVMALGERYIDSAKVRHLVYIWLDTPFDLRPMRNGSSLSFNKPEQASRHVRRISKISDLEK